MSHSWSLLQRPRQLLLLLTAGTAGVILASVMVAKKNKKKSPKPEVSSAKQNNLKEEEQVLVVKNNEQKTVEVLETKPNNSNQPDDPAEAKPDVVQSPPDTICEISSEKVIEVEVTNEDKCDAVLENEEVVEEQGEEVIKEDEEAQNKSWSDLIDEEKQQPPSHEDHIIKDANNVTDQMKTLNFVEVQAQETASTSTAAAEVTVRRDSGLESPYDESETVLLTDETKNRVASPSASSEDSLKNHKIRTDSGCSYGTAGSDDAILKSKVTGNSDSGNGSTEADDGYLYAYHFSCPGHLCGKLIGPQGSVVKELRNATNCDLKLFPAKYESRNQRYDAKSRKEPQVCILEGTRTAIERILLLIREKFPLEHYPELTLDQTNSPDPNDALSANKIEPGTFLQMETGNVSNVYVSAIVSGGQIYIQRPENPTFEALHRLECCMSQVYETLQNRVPIVHREVIDVGLVCVAKVDDRYYRLQITAFEASEDSCEVKFLDYGGYGTFYVSDLKQIRSDFLTLPFQAIECYLANVIPPNGNDWPFESAIHLEQLTSNQVISCRVIGQAEDNVPIVQLYTATFNQEKGQLESILVNKELVERGGALWVEHSVAA